MFKNIFASACLFAFSLAATEISETCLESRAHLFGSKTDDDLPFSDYDYLYNSEEYNQIYRMTRIQLCGDDSTGELVGMRAHVARFNAETMSPVKRISMNKVGTVTGENVSCTYMVLDVENGEYLQSLYIAYANPGQIDYIRATSSKDQQISKGALTNDMEASEMTSVQDSRILAFHGYENDRLAALGQVSVNLSCIKGVTTTESVDEPVLIDIENIDNQPHVTTGDDDFIPDEHAWIFILVGVILGVSLMVVIAAILVCYKQKKCCFAQIDGNQVMSMQTSFKGGKTASDIEFAGQTSSQKRKSIKQMSSIVEVDESQDIENQKKGKQDGTQLQSIASMAQVTDTEDQGSKRNL